MENKNFIEIYKDVLLNNYANFNGRARRREYWGFVLIQIILTILIYALVIVGAVAEIQALSFIGVALIVLFSLGTFIPALAAAIRRLHDTGKSGWWYLIAFIPFGGIILLVFLCTDGNVGRNEYGDDPKLPPSDDIEQIGVE